MAHQWREDTSHELARRDDVRDLQKAPDYRQTAHASQHDGSSINDEGYTVNPRPVAYRLEAPRYLDWMDVAALIINKMVGTGIFTGPLTVLQATQSKSAAVTLWVLGFLYTVIRFERHKWYMSVRVHQLILI